MARSYGFDIETSSDVREGSSQMRWAFIRKVYCLLCIQLLLTFGVSMAMFLCHPVRDFMQTTAGLFVLIAVGVVAIICENVLLAAGLTVVITVGLTLFTFVAAWFGRDFNFLGPFLSGALLMVTAFALFRIFFHVGKVVGQVIACIGTLVFSGYIIYDTNNLIQRFNYDQYIEAAISLYIDIINLFLQLLQCIFGDN
ncbi:hypothetical protein OROGR_025389 [Orobanche gracilis]